MARMAPSWIRIGKALPEIVLAQIEEPLDQQKVTGRRHRQELGDTLDDPEQYGSNGIRHP